jgi:hypothetical protein
MGELDGRRSLLREGSVERFPTGRTHGSVDDPRLSLWGFVFKQDLVARGLVLWPMLSTERTRARTGLAALFAVVAVGRSSHQRAYCPAEKHFRHICKSGKQSERHGRTHSAGRTLSALQLKATDCDMSVLRALAAWFFPWAIPLPRSITPPCGRLSHRLSSSVSTGSSARRSVLAVDWWSVVRCTLRRCPHRFHRSCEDTRAIVGYPCPANSGNPVVSQTLYKQGSGLCSSSIMMGPTEYARPSTERSVRDGTSL